MKQIFVAGIFALLLIIPALNSSAQDDAITAEDTEASLQISRNIINLVGQLAKDFPDVKGQLITTTEDLTNVYGVIGFEGMLAESHFVMVKADGSEYYVASYSGDSRKLSMSFSAFVAGIVVVTDASGDFTITQDMEKSTDSTLVYVLAIQDTKVGNYTFDSEASEGTMIIGFL